MQVRPESPDDFDTIRALTQAAFAPMRFSDGREGAIIDRLRADGDMHLSLVADDGANHRGVVGHVAFSLATLSVPGRWLTLGPVAVTPARQRSGIGTLLIEAGLERLRAQGAAGCILTGDPGYYARFGFRNDLGLTAPETPDRNVMGIAFGGATPTGPVDFAPAFG